MSDAFQSSRVFILGVLDSNAQHAGITCSRKSCPLTEGRYDSRKEEAYGGLELKPMAAGGEFLFGSWYIIERETGNRKKRFVYHAKMEGYMKLSSDMKELGEILLGGFGRDRLKILKDYT